MAAKKKTQATKKGAKTPPKTDTPTTAVGWEQKQAKPMTLAERKRARLTLLNKLRQKDAPPLIRPASTVPSTYFLRRPTGITQLDIDLGGGFPAGGVCCVSGADNAGKTTLILQTCAMHQRIYGNESAIALALVEGNPDFDWMRRVGFIVAYPDTVIEQRARDRKARGLPPFTREEHAAFKAQIGEVDMIVGETGEDVLGAVLRAIESNVYGIIVIDSISALQSSAEANVDSFHDFPQQAADANLQTRFFKKLNPAFNGFSGMNNTTVLMTQQMRSNPQKRNVQPHIAKLLPDLVPTGSNSLKHGKLIDLLLRKGSKEREKVENATTGKKDKGVVMGRDVTYSLTKGKAGTHDELTGEYHVDYDDLFEVERTLFVAGLRYGVLTERTGLISAQRGNGEVLFEDLLMPQFIERIRQDVELDLLLRREVMARAGKDCTYRDG